MDLHLFGGVASLFKHLDRDFGGPASILGRFENPLSVMRPCSESVIGHIVAVDLFFSNSAIRASLSGMAVELAICSP